MLAFWSVQKILIVGQYSEGQENKDIEKNVCQKKEYT